MFNEQKSIESLSELTPEQKEKMNASAKITLTFTHPITGEVSTEEQEGAQFIGAMLVPKDEGGYRTAFMLIGAAHPEDTVKMMRDLTKQMAKTAAGPDLRLAMMLNMMREEREDPMAAILSKLSSRTSQPRSGMSVAGILDALETMDTRERCDDPDCFICNPKSAARLDKTDES